MPQAFFVFPPDESLEQGRNWSRMLTCVIPVMLRSLIYLLTDVVFSFSNLELHCLNKICGFPLKSSLSGGYNFNYVFNRF